MQIIQDIEFHMFIRLMATQDLARIVVGGGSHKHPMQVTHATYLKVVVQAFEGVFVMVATTLPVQVYRVTQGLKAEHFYLVDKYGGQGWNRTTDTGIFSPDQAIQ